MLLKAVTVSAVLTWSGSLFHAVVAKCLHECKPNVVVLERGTYNFLAPLRDFVVSYHSENFAFLVYFVFLLLYCSRVAVTHGLARGWFTYTDICTLLENFTFYQTLNILKHETLKVSMSVMCFMGAISQSMHFIKEIKHVSTCYVET